VGISSLVPAEARAFLAPRQIIGNTRAQKGQRGNERMRKREVVAPHKVDKRYVRRDAHGQFTESQVDVGRSLTADQRSKSKTVAPKWQGDHGDQKKS